MMATEDIHTAIETAGTIGIAVEDGMGAGTGITVAAAVITIVTGIMIDR